MTQELSQNIRDWLEQVSFSTRDVDTIDCAMTPFGCNGVVALDRVQVELADGTLLGLCPQFVKHGQIAKAAGVGSEAQALFTNLINAFQKANPGREKGSQEPIHRYVQPKAPVEAEAKATADAA